MSVLSGIIYRFGRSASALVAGAIDLAVVFEQVSWSEGQIASANLFALTLIGVIFGAEKRSQASA